MNIFAARGLFLAFLITLSALTLPGCGDSVEGKYQDESGNVSIEFKDGKAYTGMMGVTTEVDYELKDDKIILKKKGETENLVLTRNKDGTLSGLPFSGPLKKKS